MKNLQEITVLKKPYYYEIHTQNTVYLLVNHATSHKHQYGLGKLDHKTYTQRKAEYAFHFTYHHFPSILDCLQSMLTDLLSDHTSNETLQPL